MSVSVAYSSPSSGSVVDEGTLEARRLEIEGLLRAHRGANASNETYNLTVTHAPVPVRRQLYFKENEPLDTSSCHAGMQVIITVMLVTNDESIEDAFIYLLYNTEGLTLPDANGDHLTSCSNPVIDSHRPTRLAPYPPNAPPPPYFSSAEIQSTGTLLIGSVLFVLVCCGMCGQRAFVPTLRRREKERKAARADIGQPLLGESVFGSSAGVDWGKTDTV